MGWEITNGQRYFYETSYIDGQRVRRCHGFGPEAEQAAERVAQEKARRDADIARVRALITHDEFVDRQVTEFDMVVQAVRNQLLTQNNIQYTRGQYRKIRSK